MKTILTLLLLICLYSVEAQVPTYVPSQNLTAWYSFSGNSADSSGNNNHMINNGATLSSDRFSNSNSAYSFDGVNDYMGITSPAFQIGETSSFTVSFWVNKANTTFGMPYWHGLTQTQGGAGKFVHFMQASATGNNMHWGTNKQGSAWVWAQSTYTVGVWEHWAGVYDNKNMKLYKNGVQVATNSYSYTGATTATMPFYIGSNVINTNSFFSGKIDDFGIWQRALSATEITTLYNGCTGVIIGGTSNITDCDSYTSSNGKIYTTSGTYSDTIMASTGCDSVITLHLTINSSSSGSLTANGCNSYTSPSGNHIWTASGTYTDILPNAMGCDSVITVNLTIIQVDISVIATQQKLTANAGSATFQWLDCDNAFGIIGGATSSVFQPIANGNYAVEVTQNNCIDTSICFPITTIGIEELNDHNKFVVYPNPSNGELQIRANLSNANHSLEIYSLEGKKVFDRNLSIEECKGKTISLSNLKDGVYLIQLKSESDIYTSRLVISR